MRHPGEIFNDISAFQVANVSAFGRERTFDNPLAVGKVYESKTALRIAINEFHSKHNFEGKVQYNEPTRLVVVCKEKYANLGYLQSLTINLNPGLSSNQSLMHAKYRPQHLGLKDRLQKEANVDVF